MFTRAFALLALAASDLSAPVMTRDSGSWMVSVGIRDGLTAKNAETAERFPLCVLCVLCGQNFGFSLQNWIQKCLRFRGPRVLGSQVRRCCPAPRPGRHGSLP